MRDVLLLQVEGEAHREGPLQVACSSYQVLGHASSVGAERILFGSGMQAGLGGPRVHAATCEQFAFVHDVGEGLGILEPTRRTGLVSVS